WPRQSSSRIAAGRRCVANELGDNALARGTDKDGISEGDDPTELDEHGERVASLLRESDSRVDSNARGMDARSLRRLDAFLELGDDLTDRIMPVGSIVVAGHVGHRAARMHQHDTAPGLSAHLGHFRVE